MRYHDIYWETTGAETGDLVSVQGAVRSGECPTEVWLDTGQETVSISESFGPQLAAAACRDAFRNWSPAASGLASSPTLHLNASCYFQGFDLWSSSCYVLDQSFQAGSTLSLSVDAQSNGMMAAVALAGRFLQAAAEGEWVLVSAGDRFCPPGLERWQVRSGYLIGDAGAAVALSRRSGFARMISSGFWAEPSLEGINRGDEVFAPASPALRRPIRSDIMWKQFLATHDLAEVQQRIHRGIESSVAQAMADADMKLGDARWVLPPFFGKSFLRREYLEPLSIEPERTLEDLGLRLGHLGSADHVVGIDALRRSGRLQPGERIVLISPGRGFTWTCIVLEVERA